MNGFNTTLYWNPSNMIKDVKKKNELNNLIKRIIESEIIGGEIIGIARWEIASGFPFIPDYFNTHNEVDYTLDSIIICGKEYKLDDFKFVYSDDINNFYHLITNSDDHFVIAFWELSNE